MERDSSAHDNTDIKISNKITIYGNVTFIGSISVVSVGFLFLFIWMFTHWAAAVMLSAILVYTLISLVVLTALALVAALWLKIVIRPWLDTHERKVEVRGQDLRNRIIYTQENAIVFEPQPGLLQVVPLFPPQKVIEAGEPELDATSIVSLYRTQSMSIKTLAERYKTTDYQIRKILLSNGISNGI